MRLRPAALCAAIIGGSLLASPATAAPDQTLGMALLSAEVDSNGTLTTAGSGASSATQLETGHYEVHFVRNIEGCIPVVTPRTNGSAAISSFAIQNGVFDGFQVKTRGNDGNPANRPFFIIVLCSR